MDPSSYIQIVNSIQGQNLNPTPQQRAVYGFYDARHSDAAEDIYSPEWFQLTQSFFEAFARENPNPITLKSWEMVEDLDFGAFFLAHPVAAYSLWHMLQACYELDRVICGTSVEELKTIATWQRLKPFIYLKSKKVRQKWGKSLKSLKKQIECGALDGEELMSKLNEILFGVERLEHSLAEMQDNFKINLKDMKYADKMLEKVADVVEERRRMIVDLLHLEDSEPVSGSDGETSNDDTLVGSDPETRTPATNTFPRPMQNSSAMKGKQRSQTESSSQEESRENTERSASFALLASAFCFGLFLAVIYLLNQSNWQQQFYI